MTNPKASGDRVLESLVNVCGPQVRGAHDSDFLVVDGTAYIVYMANDERLGEQPDWPFVYVCLSIVDAETGSVRDRLIVAQGDMEYKNAKLPRGSCFVPRLVRLDVATLRCYFVTTRPDLTESQTWFTDIDVATGTLVGSVHAAEIETPEGVFPMQPGAFSRYLQSQGYGAPEASFGLYLVDSIKQIDGRHFAVVNNFASGGIAVATLDAEMRRFTVQGALLLPSEAKLTESVVNRLPDGSWLAVSRQENRDRNYLVSRSEDARTWTRHEPSMWIRGGVNSKPTLDRLGSLYYLGWNEAPRTGSTERTVFNLDASPDGRSWERWYRFESERTFQYPVFREHAGTICLTVTQGRASNDHHAGKEQIMFGKLG